MNPRTKRIELISRKWLFTATLFLLLINAQAQTIDSITTGQIIVDTLVSASSKTGNPEAELVETKRCRHEFSIWGAGGISTLNYTPSIGERKPGMGGAFGMGYTYFFHRNWGIHIGAEMAVYNTTFRMKEFRDMYTRQGFDNLTPDWMGENEIIDYHTELSNYTEKQQLYNINIPLMLQFQTPLAGGKHQFFASAGAKLGIPIQNTYKVTDATLYTWYYDYKSNEEFRPYPGFDMEEFGVFHKNYSTKKLSNTFKIAGLASAETGVKFFLNPKLSLYVGAYLDYGFNNISKHRGNRFFEFEPENAKMISNSILTSQYIDNGKPTANFTNKVLPLSFGLKLRLGINTCPKPKKPEKKTQRPVYVQQDTIRNIVVIDTIRVVVIDSVRVYTKVEIAEYKRAAQEYGDLEDLLIFQLEGYEVNQYTLSPIMERMLDRAIAQLQRYNNSKYEIICEGHTCDLGRTSYNFGLARRRAEVVREYLIRVGGFNPNNVSVVSKGSTAPTVENIDEAHRKINRRVVFLIKKANQKSGFHSNQILQGHSHERTSYRVNDPTMPL